MAQDRVIRNGITLEPSSVYDERGIFVLWIIIWTGQKINTQLSDLCKAINQFLDNKDEVIANLEMLSSTLYDTKELKLIYESLYSQAENAKELFYKASSVGPLTDSSRIDYLQKQYDSAYRKLSETESEISRREHWKKNFEMVIAQLRTSEDQIQEFTRELFNSLVDKMTVHSRSKVIVTFRCGTEIEVGL